MSVIKDCKLNAVDSDSEPLTSSLTESSHGDWEDMYVQYKEKSAAVVLLVSPLGPSSFTFPRIRTFFILASAAPVSHAPFPQHHSSYKCILLFLESDSPTDMNAATHNSELGGLLLSLATIHLFPKWFKMFCSILSNKNLLHTVKSTLILPNPRTYAQALAQDPSPESPRLEINNTSAKNQQPKSHNHVTNSEKPQFFIEYMQLLERQSRVNSDSEYLSMLEEPMVLQPESKYVKGKYPIGIPVGSVSSFFSNEKALVEVAQKIQESLNRMLLSTCLPVSVHTYNPVLRCGPRSSTSEIHLRISFIPTWELEHLVPGHAGKGSGKSDFATLNSNGALLPFLIIEFESSGFANHKDGRVCASEGAYEMGPLIGKLNLSTTELGQLQIYLGFANNAKVWFDVLSPRYDKKSKLVGTFDLSNSHTNIMETLELLCFIETKIIPAGKVIHDLINT
ncbi:hypothetical protein HDU80_008588 [Chytriomyces hyalinus]|nr:hypothetical protein HDU80_008588 [Chytriomyces hyalinus]